MASTDRHAVIFCLDGLRADVFEQYISGAGRDGPPDSVLRRLARRPEAGGFAALSVERAKSIFPSYTLPAWAAIFTGNPPHRNGIVGNNAYYRDIKEPREYDSSNVESALRLFGYGFNYNAFPEIGCQVLGGPLEVSAIDGWDDAEVWIYNPFCWALHPGWPQPWPHKECVIDYYSSGGYQNADLRTPTLFDFAHRHGLSTYGVHQFYNRSLNGSSSWEVAYDGDLKNIDKSWARYTWQDVRDWKVLGGPTSNRNIERRAFEKARARVRSQSADDVLILYMSLIDTESHYFHRYGDNLVAVQRDALAFLDREVITPLVSELEQADPVAYRNTLFFLIADHGQTENDKARQLDNQITFPDEDSPGDLYRVSFNSYMAHLYIRSGDWTGIPSEQEVDSFMRSSLPPAYMPSGRLTDRVAFFVTRYRRVYRNWNGVDWQTLPLAALSDLEYGFVDGARRIDELLDPERAGDVIILPKRSDRPGMNTGWYSGDATHGSLWPEDTYVPFYVWGEPMNNALSRSGAIRLREARIVDLTPTVMSFLGIYNPHAHEMDGRPLFDKDLHINLTDFQPYGGVESTIEALFGRMIMG